MNFSGYVRHATIFSSMLTTVCCLVVGFWLGLGLEVVSGWLCTRIYTTSVVIATPPFLQWRLQTHFQAPEWSPLQWHKHFGIIVTIQILCPSHSKKAVHEGIWKCIYNWCTCYQITLLAQVGGFTSTNCKRNVLSLSPSMLMTYTGCYKN